MSNESKHTPGPWRLSPHVKSGWNVSDVNGNAAIARVYATHGDASASLIASAPFLLAENERLRFLLTALLEGKTNLHPNDVTAIRAALRGEAL